MLRHSSRPSAAAMAAMATYEAVCRVLAVPARPHARRALSTLPLTAPPVFTATAVQSDAHAVALAAALLASFAAPWPIIERYLSVYAPSLSLPPRPYPAFMASRLHVPSRLLVVFSHCAAMSSRGASAVLAACLLLPGGPRVELDLRRSPLLTTLSLSLWHPLLAEIHPVMSVPPTLVGLALDDCPIRTLPHDLLVHLHALRWLSMRQTAVTNHCRVADLLRALPVLSAALFSGDTRPDTLLPHMRRLCRSLDGDMEAAEEHLVPNAEDMLTDHVDDMADIQKEVISVAAHPTASATPSSQTVHPTPVTLHRLFRDFVLAHSTPSLQWLDGMSISVEDRARAFRTVEPKFENVTPCPSHCARPTPSLTAMLRNRELGLSPRASVLSDGLTQRDPRPKKRRRTTNYIPRPTDIFAALAAAGFPTIQRLEQLNPATQITVALAAASSQQAEANHPSLEMRRVQEAALSIPPRTPDSARMSIEPTPSSESAPTLPIRAGCPDASHRKLLQAGFTDYNECGFARSVSTALIRRPGAPRIDYLNQNGDRPRQFEYNPANPSELVYGTELGYLVVLNQESGVVKGSCRVGGGCGSRETGEVIRRSRRLDDMRAYDYLGAEAMGRGQECPAVYGLSWLNKRSDIFISGSNNGAIHVYNVNWMGTGERGGCMYACDTFNKLTSIHVNADDSRLAVSGESLHFGVFDLATGRRLETMRNCHSDVINVIKFAHNNPFLLVTSSFDRTVKKWDLRESRPGGGRRPIFTTQSRTDNMMACFSPDDSHLLVSAVDNEVRQFSAVDGSLVREFDIPKTGFRYNFTRSYYMNDRDYIISGSSMESVVRVYNARTGAYLTQVDMDNRDVPLGRNVCVQSLRANPLRRFNFSALLVSRDESASEVIANVDLHTRC